MKKLDSEEDKSGGKGAGSKFTAEQRGRISIKHLWPSHHVFGYFASECFSSTMPCLYETFIYDMRFKKKKKTARDKTNP